MMTQSQNGHAAGYTKFICKMWFPLV